MTLQALMPSDRFCEKDVESVAHDVDASYLLLMYISRIWSVNHSIAGCRPSPVIAFVARICQGLFCIRSRPSPATSFTVVKESGKSILFAKKRMGILRPEMYASGSVSIIYYYLINCLMHRVSNNWRIVTKA